MTKDPKESNAGLDRDWTTAPLEELIQYLSTDEHCWFRQEMELIGQKLRDLVQRYGVAFPALSHLPNVFGQLCKDLQTHMYHEEADLFPAIARYVQAMEEGRPMKGSPLSAFGGPIRVMEHEHESTGAALRLLRDFGLNYSIPADCNQEYAEVMDHLATLEDRLLRHIYLENNVLYPRAAAVKVSHKPIISRV